MMTAAAPSGAFGTDAQYEERLIQWGLDLHGLAREPNPEGKRIEAVYVASEDIISPSDPWPQLANAIHVRTKENTVRLQLLFAVGEPYSASLAAETERNLRTLFIFAVARVVPVRGSQPDSVGVLVVTKDLWSLRLGLSYSLVGSLLQFLELQPVEQNFLGMDKTLQLDFLYKLDTLTFGQLFYDPRLFGSRLELLEQVDVLFNRGTDQAEGSYGQLQVDRPLFSLATQWGFSVAGSWDIEHTRNYRGADIWLLPYPNATAPVAQIPYVYDTHVLGALGLVTRSFGHDFKTNVSAGIGGHIRRYTVPYNALYTDDERAWLAANDLPYSETATYLTATVQAFQAKYSVLRNIDTFALSEDVQLGPFTYGALRWSNPAWGSPIRFVEAGVSGGYRAYWADDLITVSVAATARYMPGVSEAGVVGPWVNERVAMELRNYAPNFGGWGRWVVRALADYRRNDLNHGFDFLGGDVGLRGLAADQFVGTREVLFNVEYRTRPLEFHTVYTGLVLFWDTGDDAGLASSSNAPIFGLGVGIRILFPQINVQTIRIDFGYAINGPLTPILDRFSSTFGQVTDIRLQNSSGASFLDTPL